MSQEATTRELIEFINDSLPIPQRRLVQILACAFALDREELQSLANELWPEAISPTDLEAALQRPFINLAGDGYALLDQLKSPLAESLRDYDPLPFNLLHGILFAWEIKRSVQAHDDGEPIRLWEASVRRAIYLGARDQQAAMHALVELWRNLPEEVIEAQDEVPYRNFLVNALKRFSYLFPPGYADNFPPA